MNGSEEESALSGSLGYSPKSAQRHVSAEHSTSGFHGAVGKQGHETRRVAGAAGGGADTYARVIRDWLEDLPPRPWDDRA
jgi:hypothetical protein